MLGNAEAQALNADPDFCYTEQAHELVQDKGSHGDDVGPPIGDPEMDDLLKAALFELFEKSMHLIETEGIVVHFEGIKVFQSLADLGDGGEGSRDAVDMISGGKKGQQA